MVADSSAQSPKNQYVYVRSLQMIVEVSEQHVPDDVEDHDSLDSREEQRRVMRWFPHQSLRLFRQDM